MMLICKHCVKVAVRPLQGLGASDSARTGVAFKRFIIYTAPLCLC